MCTFGMNGEGEGEHQSQLFLFELDQTKGTEDRSRGKSCGWDWRGVITMCLAFFWANCTWVSCSLGARFLSLIFINLVLRVSVHCMFKSWAGKVSWASLSKPERDEHHSNLLRQNTACCRIERPFARSCTDAVQESRSGLEWTCLN